jgi:preprotein translocase subunit YajC
VTGYFLIIVMLGLVWFLLIRPQRRRQTEQQQLLARIAPGEEVVTAGGLYGTVREVDGDDVRLEVAPGTTVRVAKRAIAAVVPPEDEEEDEEADEEGVETHPLGESAEPSTPANLSSERG